MKKRIITAFMVIIGCVLFVYAIWLFMSTIGDLPPFIHKGKVVLGGYHGFKS